MPLPTEEPVDPAELPLAHIGRPADPDAGAGRPSHLRLVVGGAVAIVVAGLVLGIVLVNSSAPPLGRGAESASVAATRYLAAVNAGDGQAAAAIACDRFADEARAQARTGADAGIGFRLGRVQTQSATDATAAVIERIEFPGGHVQNHPLTLDIARSGGRWLVCGHGG